MRISAVGAIGAVVLWASAGPALAGGYDDGGPPGVGAGWGPSGPPGPWAGPAPDYDEGPPPGATPGLPTGFFEGPPPDDFGAYDGSQSFYEGDVLGPGHYVLEGGVLVAVSPYSGWWSGPPWAFAPQPGFRPGDGGGREHRRWRGGEGD